ncbi:MAG: Dabb family protein [Acidobacteria bacterium]|nr:Dabb family protein [Acidobacteriota bacterium]
MYKQRQTRMVFVLAGGLLFMAGWILGQHNAATEKTVVHAVAWTAGEGFTEQGLEDFKKATADLTGAMPGLKRAWVGKLRTPLVQGEITRNYGLVLEFEDLKTREAYSSHPARAPWVKVWEKIRVTGSTNFDVLGE